MAERHKGQRDHTWHGCAWAAAAAALVFGAAGIRTSAAVLTFGAVVDACALRALPAVVFAPVGCAVAPAGRFCAVALLWLVLLLVTDFVSLVNCMRDAIYGFLHLLFLDDG